ncbi:regulatory protein AfsR [Actinorhabdospora filicis]|uniref:Regulatory protein AfsR n=1 Tax=Actinorhabdospora filicis TaxID=1785913 RepID=A0A9W6SPK2_9ACTN|nr:BTAD domain-containing putative transcriptional regulator [Actinorhabdospora filicis]GLZ80639.1 regulatory protein AfsR [Actinorhabdospora filicis]
MIRAAVLGPVRLLAAGTPVELSGRPAAVLAVLALDAGRPVARDAVIEAVWGEDAPKTVANQLQIAVHRLRAALTAAGAEAHAVLRLEPAGYLLDLPTDLAEFRELAESAATAARGGEWARARDLFGRAEGLWRGPVPELPGFAALDEERLTVAENGLIAALLAGDHAEAVAGARALLAQGPPRERPAHVEVLALALSGDLPAARAAHARAAEAITTATGLDPGRAFGELGGRLGGDLGPALALVRGWLAGPERRTRPMELPAEIRDFVGRRAEEELLAAALRDGGVATVVGLGGIGKTALAVRVARAVEAHHPDGCLFIDLRGADPEPRAAGAVLDVFLRSLGVSSDAIPAGVPERAALYRALLAERRVLVVLDNALDAAQIRDLLPGPGGAALVTSRNALPGLGTTDVPLGVLTDAEAADLVTRLSGHEAGTGEVGALVDLTGRLPLAVRIVAARMSRRRDLGYGRMLTRLATEERRLDELADGDRRVRSCIDIGYRRLSEAARTMLVLAAWLPVSEFSLGTLTGFTGLDAAGAETVARELEEAQFLFRSTDAEGAARRFTLHDLVRLFAREDAADGADLRRGYRALLAAAIRADEAQPFLRYLSPDAPDGLPALDPAVAALTADDPRSWFQAQRELLLSAPTEAGRAGDPDIAWRLFGATSTFLVHDFRGEDYRAMLDGAWAYRDRLGGEAHAYLGIAQAVLLRLEFDLAGSRAYARRARVAYRRSGDLVRAVAVCFDLSSIHRALGDFRLARAVTAWGENALEGLGDGPLVLGLRGWMNISAANNRSDRTEEALAHSALALELFERVGDGAGIANATGICGQMLGLLGRPGEAVANLHRSAALYAAFGQINAGIGCRIYIAEVHVGEGDFDEAERLLDTVLADANGPALLASRAGALRVRALLELRRGDLRRARELADESLEACRAIGVPRVLTKSLHIRAEVALAEGDPVTARAHAEEALTALSPDSPLTAPLEELLAKAGGAPAARDC